MKSSRRSEIIVATILALLLILFVDPMGLSMSYDMHEFLLSLAVVVFGLYVGLFQSEDPTDERERWHVMVASRGGYVAALFTAAIGVFVQAMSGTVDTWLMIVLLMLVLARVLSGIWARDRY